jgi:adenosylmethionine-8-amino-7-oxononanoate aminotransferase
MLALRQVLADARARGLFGYVVLLEDQKRQEAKLMRICQKAGGMLRPFSGVVAFGSTDWKY